MAAKHVRSIAPVAVVFALALTALAPVAQPPQKPFRSETDLVLVTATVLDREGRAVTNLTQPDFAVREDDVRQEVALFALDVQTPISLTVLVDTSGSMVDKVDDVQDALRHLVAGLKVDDEIALLEFSNRVDLLTDFGARLDSVSHAINRLSARGGTALFDAVLDGLKTLQRGQNRKKALFVITDGNDNDSRSRLSDVVDDITKAETIVYCLGIGHGERGSFGHGVFDRADTVDIRTLRAIAVPSGGRAELLENAHRGRIDLVDQAVATMKAELSQQYTLGYYPTNTAKDGTYRRLTVTTTNPRLTVRARKGYRAPAR